MSPAINQFTDVNTFARRFQPEIALFEAESFGHFHYSPEGLFNRDLPYFEYSSSDGLHVQVHLSNTAAGETEISSVAVQLGDDWWSIDRYEVCQGMPHALEKTSSNKLQYPHFRFRWDAKEGGPTEVGRLNYAEVNIAPYQSAFFSYPSAGTEHRVLHNLADSMHSHGVEIPQSLRGKSSFFGKPLLWHLDVRAKQAEILKASQLEGFLLSVPLR